MLVPDIENGERESDFIVEVALGLQHAEFLAEHRGDHLLCARLAHAAGDAHHTDIQRAAVVLCNIFERLFAGVYFDIRVGDVAEILFGDRTESSFFHYLRNKGMAVHACALDGHEEAALFCLPAVDDNAGNLLIQELCASAVCTAACGGNFL